jgi:hypothetical protein
MATITQTECDACKRLYTGVYINQLQVNLKDQYVDLCSTPCLINYLNSTEFWKKELNPTCPTK